MGKGKQVRGSLEGRRGAGAEVSNSTSSGRDWQLLALRWPWGQDHGGGRACACERDSVHTVSESWRLAAWASQERLRAQLAPGCWSPGEGGAEGHTALLLRSLLRGSGELGPWLGVTGTQDSREPTGKPGVAASHWARERILQPPVQYQCKHSQYSQRDAAAACHPRRQPARCQVEVKKRVTLRE